MTLIPDGAFSPTGPILVHAKLTICCRLPRGIACFFALYPAERRLRAASHSPRRPRIRCPSLLWDRQSPFGFDRCCPRERAGRGYGVAEAGGTARRRRRGHRAVGYGPRKLGPLVERILLACTAHAVTSRISGIDQLVLVCKINDFPSSVPRICLHSDVKRISAGMLVFVLFVHHAKASLVLGLCNRQDGVQEWSDVGDTSLACSDQLGLGRERCLSRPEGPGRHSSSILDVPLAFWAIRASPPSAETAPAVVWPIAPRFDSLSGPGGLRLCCVGRQLPRRLLCPADLSSIGRQRQRGGGRVAARGRDVCALEGLGH